MVGVVVTLGQVRLEECGESFYNGRIPAVIDELQSKGLLELDNGATIMWCGEKYRVPLMIRKSDGGFGYVRAGLVVGHVGRSSRGCGV